MILEVTLGIIIIFFLIFVIIYNSLIGMRNGVKNSWHGIEIQLKRRRDLIPNLVNSVKGYAKHEKNLLKEITSLRVALLSSENNVKKSAAADNLLSKNLKSLFAVVENYPKLKANENFLKLQEELTNTENEIAAARRIYNNNVRDYNTKTQVFPNNIIANLFGFYQEEFFTASENDKKNINSSLKELDKL